MKTTTYFSRQTSTPHEQEKLYLNSIKEKFPGTQIIQFNLPYIPNKNGINKEAWLNENYFFPLIDKCDNFVYLLSTNKGSKKVGVRAELNYAIKKDKKIYRLYNNSINIMDASTFKKIYDDSKKKDRNWVLNHTDEYKRFYINNIEAAKLIKRQFKEFDINNKKAMQAVIPHRNTLWGTNNLKKEYIEKWCEEHKMKHSIIDLNTQVFSSICPYEDISSIIPSYGKRKLDNINEFSKNLIVSNRVIHKLFWILDEEAFKPLGFCLKDEKGNLLYKNGKEIADESKIIGAEPLFDIDIKKEVKDKGGSFFDIEIFNEYIKVIDLLKKFIETDVCNSDYKIGFSGNGLYIILEPMIFEEFDSDYITFDAEWCDYIKKFNKLIDEKGIKNIHLDNKYGWNRYFKALGTFHAYIERVSIPLNKDELLDYKWIKEITEIKLGLEQNVFNEIINKAGNSWR